MDDWVLPKPRLALLLEHFAAVEDVREPWRAAYPLRDVLRHGRETAGCACSGGQG